MELIRLLCVMGVESKTLSLPNLAVNALYVLSNTLWYAGQGISLVVGPAITPPPPENDGSNDNSDTSTNTAQSGTAMPNNSTPSPAATSAATS